MSCWQTIQDYALRSVGYGERLLPRDDFTLCQQFTLIGSGMIWNIYFGVLALLAGFFFATALALGKGSRNAWLRKPAEWFIFVFRGSPLFVQFFFGYFLFLSLKQHYTFFEPFTAAWLGALIVLFLQHRRLCRRDLLRRAAIHPQGRCGRRRCLWPLRLVPLPPKIDLAHDATSGMARLYQ